MNGWILLHKKIWDNKLFNGNYRAIAVWVWLLTHCNEKGEVTCGRNQISGDTGVKAGTVRYWLKKFLQEKHQLATIETTNKFSTFLILNWVEYQRKNTNASVRNIPATSRQTTTNKEIKNKEKEITHSENFLKLQTYLEKDEKQIHSPEAFLNSLVSKYGEKLVDKLLPENIGLSEWNRFLDFWKNQKV